MNVIDEGGNVRSCGTLRLKVTCELLHSSDSIDNTLHTTKHVLCEYVVKLFVSPLTCDSLRRSTKSACGIEKKRPFV